LADAPLDVAIVPGMPFKDGKWDTLIKSRILWSLYLYKKGIVKNLIYSGDAVYTPYVEGKCMSIYAVALGIDPTHIYIDTLAQHSTENLYYGYKLAKRLGFSKIAIATDPFQCSMLYSFSKKHFDTRFYFLPVIYDSIASFSGMNPLADTRAAHVDNFVSIKDRMNTANRFKGTLGKGIKYD
jgi:vancomycin permeability regulator SanA